VPAPRRPSAIVDAGQVHAAPVVDVRAADPPPAAGVDEAALIADAETALANGDAARALEVLDRHALRFPIGVRAEDRLALRIRALCALGRTAEAKAEVEGVRRVRPDAPGLRRIADTCAAR
jgi:hypothetical protein